MVHVKTGAMGVVVLMVLIMVGNQWETARLTVKKRRNKSILKRTKQK